MEAVDWVVAVTIGFGAGVLSGLFGVGGGIVMTPAIQAFLGAAPIVSLATPLPVIVPTAATGALRYRRAGEVDLRAAVSMGSVGALSAIAGAQLAEAVDTALLLLVTAALLAWQSINVVRGATRHEASPRPAQPGPLVAIGLAAGFVSGLLGIGGGIVMVPLMAGWLGMPLRRALGTSLAAIVLMVIPGTIVHALNDNIDWAIALGLTLGAVPGARVGSAIALGARERTLRISVGAFLLVVSVLYGVRQVSDLLSR